MYPKLKDSSKKLMWPYPLGQFSKMPIQIVLEFEKTILNLGFDESWITIQTD